MKPGTVRGRYVPEGAYRAHLVASGKGLRALAQENKRGGSEGLGRAWIHALYVSPGGSAQPLSV